MSLEYHVRKLCFRWSNWLLISPTLVLLAVIVLAYFAVDYSFLGLAFSPHQGLASMGLVITIGIFWIMACTFILLPAISKLVLKPKTNLV